MEEKKISPIYPEGLKVEKRAEGTSTNSKKVSNNLIPRCNSFAEENQELDLGSVPKLIRSGDLAIRVKNFSPLITINDSDLGKNSRFVLDKNDINDRKEKLMASAND